MPYVNEYIPDRDLKKFIFSELDKRLSKGGVPRTDRAIDRAADNWFQLLLERNNNVFRTTVP